MQYRANDKLKFRTGYAFAGGMLPASELFGQSTRIDICSYWIGLGFTWHFDRPPSPLAAAGP